MAKSKFPAKRPAALKTTQVQVTRAVREEWSEYLLEDGTRLKIRPIPLDVQRIEGVFDPMGNPTYQIQIAVVLNATPRGARKK